MCTTFVDGEDVVNFFCRGQTFGFQALLTQGMCLYISVTDFSPTGAVTLVTVVWTFVFVVLSVHHPGVFLAVTSVGKFGTAGVTARFLWLGLLASVLWTL